MAWLGSRPRSANTRVHIGPASCRVRSTTVIPDSGPIVSALIRRVGSQSSPDARYVRIAVFAMLDRRRQIMDGFWRKERS